eukprot:6944103-Prorocentrum_lima.AAC.1
MAAVTPVGAAFELIKAAVEAGGSRHVVATLGVALHKIITVMGNAPGDMDAELAARLRAVAP